MSTTTIDLDEKTYGQLLGRTLPHVIHTDEECERLTNELLRLDERDDPSPEEKELAELLTVLVDEYEERRYPIRKASPQRTLQHLMEARNLTQKDLRGISRQAIHKQNASKKTRWVFSCQCGAVHLREFRKSTSEGASLGRNSGRVVLPRQILRSVVWQVPERRPAALRVHKFLFLCRRQSRSLARPIGPLEMQERRLRWSRSWL